MNTRDHLFQRAFFCLLPARPLCRRCRRSWTRPPAISSTTANRLDARPLPVRPSRTHWLASVPVPTFQSHRASHSAVINAHTPHGPVKQNQPTNQPHGPPLVRPYSPAFRPLSTPSPPPSRARRYHHPNRPRARSLRGRSHPEAKP